MARTRTVSDAKFFAETRARRLVENEDPERYVINDLRAWDNDNKLKEHAADLLETRWVRLYQLEAVLAKIVNAEDEIERSPFIIQARHLLANQK